MYSVVQVQALPQYEIDKRVMINVVSLSHHPPHVWSRSPFWTLYLKLALAQRFQVCYAQKHASKYARNMTTLLSTKLNILAKCQPTISG